MTSLISKIGQSVTLALMLCVGATAADDPVKRSYLIKQMERAYELTYRVNNRELETGIAAMAKLNAGNKVTFIELGSIRNARLSIARLNLNFSLSQGDMLLTARDRNYWPPGDGLRPLAGFLLLGNSDKYQELVTLEANIARRMLSEHKDADADTAARIDRILGREIDWKDNVDYVKRMPDLMSRAVAAMTKKSMDSASMIDDMVIKASDKRVAAFNIQAIPVILRSLEVEADRIKRLEANLADIDKLVQAAASAKDVGAIKRRIASIRTERFYMPNCKYAWNGGRQSASGGGVRIDYGEMAELFNAYRKSIKHDKSVSMRMVDALYAWFIEHDYAIPEDRRVLLDKNRTEIAAEQAKNGD